MKMGGGFIGLSALLLLLGLCAAAQEKTEPIDTPARKPAPVAPAISKKDLALAKRLIQEGEAEMGAYEPPTRTYLCTLIAGAKKKIDVPGARDLLFRCLANSHDVEEKEQREQMQGWISGALFSYGPEAEEELLPQVEGRARQTVREQLLKHYTEKANYDRAMALIYEIRPEEEQFPYQAASELMAHLPEQRSGDKSTIFAQALSHFKQSPPPPNIYVFHDLGSMLARFGTQLPRKLVMEAVDAVLSNAREKENREHTAITMVNNDKSATFNSMYEYRLFQVLPAIRAIDPDRAEQMLKENRAVQARLEELPQGMRSLDPSMRDTPKEKDEKDHPVMMWRRGDANPVQDEALRRIQKDRRQQAGELVKLAGSNPRQAIATAGSLPVTDDTSQQFKCGTLQAIGEKLQTTEPGFAVQAINESVKCASGMPYLEELEHLKDAANLLIKMDEKDAALKVIERGTELADKLYDKDHNSGDPNEAIRPFWPATAVWKTFVKIALKISPAEALGLIKEIQDDEIKTCVKASLANVLLGSDRGAFVIQEKRKSGQNDNDMVIQD